MKAISKRTKSLLASIVCGALCAICVAIYVVQVDQRANAAQADMLARYGGDQVEVCVARRDIAAGQTITDGDLETKMWIASMLPSDAIVNKADALGQQVGSSILQGEVISSARFGFDAANIEVPDGLVALSVPARAVQAVGGALTPGMTVDVYAVGSSSTSRIAQQVTVLETCATEGSSIAGTWVTLALAPEKVAEMISAAENLELYFVLPSESAVQASISQYTTETSVSRLKDDMTNGDVTSHDGSDDAAASSTGRSLATNAVTGDMTTLSSNDAQRGGE